MSSNDIARAYQALSPEELIERYKAGERNFKGINLLRAELEHMLGSDQIHSTASIEGRGLEAINPLWADFRNPVDRRFEWDMYGHFIPVQFDDFLPPRDLGGVDLSSVDLEGAYLYPVSLVNANLSGANLREAKLFDANLEGANLNKADLRGASLNDAKMQSAKLYMARLERAVLSGTDLRSADLRRAKLEKTILVGADLRGADLRKAHFGRTNLDEARLEDTSLKDVKLRDVFVRGVSIATSQQSEFLAALGIRVLASKE